MIRGLAIIVICASVLCVALAGFSALIVSGESGEGSSASGVSIVIGAVIAAGAMAIVFPKSRKMRKTPTRIGPHIDALFVVLVIIAVVFVASLMAGAVMRGGG